MRTTTSGFLLQPDSHSRCRLAQKQTLGRCTRLPKKRHPAVSGARGSRPAVKGHTERTQVSAGCNYRALRGRSGEPERAEA
ncbi:hypothetical protein V5799_025378 [Amblyomma americanum]|uniref:Uncharacterized protein n=1 Tax=Amblyomma americanum TaxID=6943 RepID=A0AAQ4E9R5_AMBAM